MVMKNIRTNSIGFSARPDSIYCLIYIAVLLWLLLGLLRVAAWGDIAAYFLYVFSFCLTAYLLIKKAPLTGRALHPSVAFGRTLIYLIIIGAVAFPLLHWWQLGGAPLLRAFVTAEYLEIVLIRQYIYENAHPIWRYGASLTVLSVLPFLVFLLLVKRSRWFWVFAVFALAYATSLMQKSYAIAVFLPAVIFALETRNFKVAGLLSLLSSMAIVVMVFATNPASRPNIGLISTAVAATTSEAIGNQQEAWTAYGEEFEPNVAGRFAPTALHFTGKNALYSNRSGSKWEIGREDFSLEFWMYPLNKLNPGDISVLFWNGSESGDWRGASRIIYGMRDDGETYIEFNLMDRSGDFSLATYAKGEVKLNQWNHIYVARVGGTSYLGLNGVMAQSTGMKADLSLNEGDKGIVQFGAQFGREFREVASFFHGYIDEIGFSKGRVKRVRDYVVPKGSLASRSPTLRDIVDFEKAPRVLESPPEMLFGFVPHWAAGLIHRVLFVPGEVVGHWFAVIPSELPFANGCAYRPLAAVLGCTHMNFAQMVYASYNKYLIEKGVSGTMNAASFMEDYANFGISGLVGGGIFLAALLYLLGVLFAGRRKIGIALNIAPLLYLSSSALLPLLFSGGWLLTILLYAIFYDELNSSMEGNECAA